MDTTGPLLRLVLLCLIATGAHGAELELVDLPAGSFVMGDRQGEQNEAPRIVQIDAFSIMRHEVTNEQFSMFVAATGYVTDSEKEGMGWVWRKQWTRVLGANWRRPHGVLTNIVDRERHPVVQVSARDAAEFCAAHDARLPTEQEWEYAARGPSDGRRYPWGDAPPESEVGKRHANFGQVDCCGPDNSDGYAKTAPVAQFPSGTSAFGLLDMAGNVWEWTGLPYVENPDWVTLRGGGWGNNPYGLRVSYRHGNPGGLGLDMVGFRCARSPRAAPTRQAVLESISGPEPGMPDAVTPSSAPMDPGAAQPARSEANASTTRGRRATMAVRSTPSQRNARERLEGLERRRTQRAAVVREQ